jgi:hypothetical protein
MNSLTSYDSLYPAPEDGKKGDSGPIPFPYGEYDSTISYTCTERIAPYVMCEGNYYVMNKVGTFTGINPKTDYAANGSSATWLLMEHYKALFVEIFMANFAKLASAVFKGDYMFSQHGVDANGNDSTDFSKFTDASGTAFIPNILIDFLTGEFRGRKMRLSGSLATPFTVPASSFDPDLFSDNVAILTQSNGVIYSLPWTMDCIGRKLTLVNFAWDRTTQNGYATIAAPNDGTYQYYFYEDGKQKTSISISRCAVELIGYGDRTRFYGWIVMNRRDVATNYTYGRALKMLAIGTVFGSSTSASISYKTFDDQTMSVTRLGTGEYKVTFPSSWSFYQNDYMVMLTGLGGADGGTSAPIKGTLKEKGTTYFTVWLSDDDSTNEGSVQFMMFNKNDWTDNY